MTPLLTFDYSRLGRGNIILTVGEVSMSYPARCGSVNHGGLLVNATPPGEYWIVAPSVDTQEVAMVIDGVGWKVALYIKHIDDRLERTHYLIHPDGNKPGSDGCIVTPGIALDLRELMDDTLKQHGPFPARIKREE